MRHTISGLIAAIVVTTASAAQACGWGYVSPCAQPYVYASPAPVYGCCGAYERLPDPVPHHYSDYVHQYYYVNQGPTYTGPGNFAPYPVYEESGVSGWEAYGHRPYYGYRGHRHGFHAHRGMHYGTMHHHNMAHGHMMHEHMHHD
jgi:hypothetical protein